MRLLTALWPRLQSWRRNRRFWGHAERKQASLDGLCVNDAPAVSGPVGDTLRFAEGCDVHIPACVPDVGSPGHPPAVARAISKAVVYPVDLKTVQVSVGHGPFSELKKVLPFLADGDAATAVACVVAILWVGTPLVHGIEDSVHASLLSACNMPMSGHARGNESLPHATARPGFVGHCQAPSPHLASHPTIAPAGNEPRQVRPWEDRPVSNAITIFDIHPASYTRKNEDGAGGGK